MTSARQHVAQEPYNRADVGTRGLACPFAKSDPETYMSIDACKATDGFKEPRLLLYVRPGPPSGKGRMPLPIMTTKLTTPLQ